MPTAETVFSTDRQALAARLRTILPAHCLLVDDEDLRPYECDGLTAYRELPLAVCLPESEGQVIDVLRTCPGSACRWSRVAPVPACRAGQCRMPRAWSCRWPVSTGF